MLSEWNTDITLSYIDVDKNKIDEYDQKEDIWFQIKTIRDQSEDWESKNSIHHVEKGLQDNLQIH